MVMLFTDSNATVLPADLTTADKLIIRNCHDLVSLNKLTDVRELIVENCPKLVDLGECVSIDTLVLGYLPALRTLDKITRVKELIISECGLMSLNPLKYAETLSISDCEVLEDLGFVENCTTLELSHCDSIKSLSAVREIGGGGLLLYYCKNLRHIALSKLNGRVSICHCPNLMFNTVMSV